MNRKVVRKTSPKKAVPKKVVTTKKKVTKKKAVTPKRSVAQSVEITKVLLPSVGGSALTWVVTSTALLGGVIFFGILITLWFGHTYRKK